VCRSVLQCGVICAQSHSTSSVLRIRVRTLTATCCIALQRTATHCNTMQRTETYFLIGLVEAARSLQRNPLENTATHCNALIYRTGRGSSLISTHCIVLQRTATHWNTLKKHFFTGLVEAARSLQQIALHCNALQRTATQWTTLFHRTGQGS